VRWIKRFRRLCDRSLWRCCRLELVVDRAYHSSGEALLYFCQHLDTVQDCQLSPKIRFRTYLTSLIVHIYDIQVYWICPRLRYGLFPHRYVEFDRALMLCEERSVTDAEKEKVLTKRKSILGQAQIVLEDLIMTSSSNGKPNMKAAKEKIDQTLQNEQALAEAAQEIKYSKLIQDLRAKGMPVTREEIEDMDKF
jgi:hypothetical protein